MREKNVNVNLGGSWLGLLGIIFVVLKLVGVAPIGDWSWWLVLLPFYVGLAIVFGAVALVGVVAAFMYLLGAFLDMFDKNKNKNKRRF